MHCAISIHALREEGDARTASCGFSYQNFYPRPPRGGRPTRSKTPCLFCGISIHALREEGDEGISRQDFVYIISIHALREEGDTFITERYIIITISIHALREEGDAANLGLC